MVVDKNILLEQDKLIQNRTKKPPKQKSHLRNNDLQLYLNTTKASVFLHFLENRDLIHFGGALKLHIGNSRAALKLPVVYFLGVLRNACMISHRSKKKNPHQGYSEA